jgi:hypothetical protein
MRNPISELSTKTAFAWLACSIIGPFLASWGWSPFVVQTGKQRMPTEQTPESLSELLVSLMPGGDDRSMWRDYMASALEQVAATDDLSLLRAAKGA